MERQHLVPLLVTVVVAFLAPLVSLRFRAVKVPAIIVEITLGIVLGQSGLRVIEATPVMDFLAGFGFIFLMFLSGFELDLSLLRSGRPRSWASYVLPFVIFSLTLTLSLACAALLKSAGMVRDVFLFALILSTTSVGIVLPILKERGETGARYGQVLIISALVADLTTILLLTLYVISTTRGPSAESLLVSLVFLAFVAVYLAGRSLRQVAVIGKLLDELAHASTQIKVRGSLAVLVVFVVLAEAIGVEAILSAFLAGLLVSFLARGSRLSLGAKLDAVGYGFFIPLFFVTVGAELDLPAAFAHRAAYAFVPLLLLMAFVVKLVPSLLLRSLFGWRDTLAGGALLSSRLALIIAASAIALELGAITARANAAVILTAIATCLLSPAVYTWLRGDRRSRKPRVIVIGAGRVGRSLIQRLAAHEVETVVVDRDAGKLARLDQTSVRPVEGDAWAEESLDQLCPCSDDVLVALTDDDELNLSTCRIARQRFGITRTVARDNLPENTARFEAAGVVPLELTTTLAVAAESLVLRPTLMNLMSDRAGEIFAFEVRIREPGSVGRRIRDLPQLGDALLVLIRRGEHHLIPHGDTRLEAGDSVVLIGTAEDEARFRDRLDPKEAGGPTTR